MNNRLRFRNCFVQCANGAKPQAEVDVLLERNHMVIAHHLIWTAYGYWLPNDPRGSMSKTIACDVIAELGELHYGRKKVQPSAGKFGNSTSGANSVLKHPLLDFAVRDFPDHCRCVGRDDPRTQLHLLRLCDHAGSRPYSDSQAQASSRRHARQFPANQPLAASQRRTASPRPSRLGRPRLEGVSRHPD